MKGKSKALLVLVALCVALALTATTALAAGVTDCTGGDSCQHEAAIGSTHYATLAEAIADADAGDTVVVLNSTNIASIIIWDDITIDLAGNTLTINSSDASYGLAFVECTGQLQNGQIIDERSYDNNYDGWVTVFVQDANLTTDDLVIKAYRPNTDKDYNYPIRVRAVSKDASLTLNDGTIIEELANNNEVNSYGTCGVSVLGNTKYKASLVVNKGVEITSKTFSIVGNGTADNTDITINGGTITSTDSNVIYHPQEGNLTINGGQLTGKSGVQFCGAGKITITGGTIRATGEYTEFPNKPPEQNDGSIDDGAALSLVSRGGGYQAGDTTVVVEITGGELISDNNAAVTSYRYAQINGQWTTEVDNTIASSLESVEIKGGSFTGDERKGALDILEQEEDNAYSISGGEFSSPVDVKHLADSVNYELQGSNGYSYYPTLAAAMDAAAPGDDIKGVNQDPDTQMYKVTLDYDVKSMADSVIEVPENTSFTLPDARRTGYDLVGWEDEDNDSYDVGDEVKITDDITFTAIWEEIDEGEYAIKIVVSGNGEVKASDKYADKGDRITLTVDPDRGYELYSLTITDADGDKVSYRDRGDGEYTFTMPDSKVTVKAVFTKIVTGLPFVDVASNAWYYDAVEYVYDNELFEGMSAYIFGPNEPMNRAMLVTVLYRLEDEPRVTAANNFSDVVNNSWYEDAVLWANEHGIVEGYGNGLFKPLDNINREQIATIMYRYAIYKGMDTVTLEENLIGFVDGNKVSGWAVQAMNWAVGQGIFSGRGANNLEPQSNATRAEVAQIMMNYLEK